MTDVRAAVAAALGHDLEWVGEPLRGSDRAVVRRARAGDRRVVVKAFAPERSGEGFVREAAALRALAVRGTHALELLASGTEPPFVVTADLGTGPSLADALLDRDPVAADVALAAWVDAVASVHRAGPAAVDAFDRELVALAGDLPVDPDPTPGEVEHGIGLLRQLLPTLGVDRVDDGLAELAALPGELRTESFALSPGDTCPDNNVSTADGLVLVDFEGGCRRHIAWDAAYLLAPWPTCWCAWALPQPVAETGLARWRAAVRPSFPVVGTDAFERDLTVVAAVWSLVTSGWFLRNALGADPPPEDPRLHGLVPRRRALIQHRLRGVLDRDRGDTPAVCELADRMLAAAVRTWGEVVLPLAPAYRATGPGRTLPLPP